MAVSIEVVGNGHFQGARTNLTQYSSTEDSTPIDPSDSSGGTGMIDFTVVEDADPEGTILLLNDTVELEDGSNGRTRGLVYSVNSTGGEASVSAYARLVALNVDRGVAPFTGTLENAFRFYLGQVGIVDGIVVDDTVATRPVVFPGFSGNMWESMKQMCAAQQVEITLVSSNIVLRALRTREVQNRTDISQNWSVGVGDAAQFIEIYNYNNEYKASGMIYPKGGWTEDMQVYQVDANETIEVEIPVDVSVQSVVQPTPVLNVPRYYEGGGSVYAIAGKDGLPIPPAQWTAQGGFLTVRIGDDSQTLIVTIKGPNEPQYEPYSIAVQSGPSEKYSSLRIAGTGVFFNKELLTLPTAADASRATQIIGVTIDNPFIGSLTQAYTAGMLAAGKFSGTVQKLDVTALVVNRKGEKGTMNYPTIQTFNTEWASKTIAQFKTTWAGQSFDQFNKTYLAKVQDAFENQAFGNVGGSRVKFRQAWYRIRSATVTQANISYTAERDTLVGDFKSVWQGATFAQFKARFAGKTFSDFGVIPLWR